MTGTGGAFREGKASRHDAAGDSVPPDVNAVKKHRPRRPWRVAFFALAAAGVLAAAAWILLGSRLIAVRSVIVTGTHLVPVSQVLAVADIAPGTPLIRLNTGQVAARVAAIRQVRSVQVTRSWPDRVVIAVREWAPSLAVTAPDGGYDLMDADGVVLQRVTDRPAGIPLYPAPAAGVSLRGSPDVASAAAVLGELPAWLKDCVVAVTAPGPDQVTLRLAGGVSVVWGGTDRAAAKAAELGALLRTRMHSYDVSAPGSVTAG